MSCGFVNGRGGQAGRRLRVRGGQAEGAVRVRSRQDLCLKSFLLLICKNTYFLV